jgi:ribokinase
MQTPPTENNVLPTKPQLLVFGSYIAALVMEVPRLPQTGETLTGHRFRQTHGGKGSNMAVQAARLGAEVTFAGVIGQDASGDAFLAALAGEGITTHAVRRSATAPTGTGFIVVDSSGRNMIVIDPGANLEFTPDNDFERLRPLVLGCGAALAQCEIPLATALEGLAAAKAAGARTILNPAPASNLTAYDLSAIDYLTPNETEARVCLGLDPAAPVTEEQLAAGLLELGVGAVVFTRGERGALLIAHDRRVEQGAFQVDVRDTVGAGDSFNASFATALAEGCDEIQALRFACAAASLSTTRSDTLASYHRRSEVEVLL